MGVVVGLGLGLACGNSATRRVKLSGLPVAASAEELRNTAELRTP